MNIFKDPKTNWKYVLIVVQLSVLAGGVVLGYYYLGAQEGEEVKWIKLELRAPDIKQLEEKGPEVRLSGTIEDSEVLKIWERVLSETLSNEQARQEIAECFCEDLFPAGGEPEVVEVSSLTPVDLNEDGEEELIIEGFKCDVVSIAGATGNAPFCIFQKIDNTLREITDKTMLGGGVSIEESKTGSYYDLSTEARLGGTKSVLSHYKWQESFYELMSEEIIENPEPGCSREGCG